MRNFIWLLASCACSIGISWAGGIYTIAGTSVDLAHGGGLSSTEYGTSLANSSSALSTANEMGSAEAQARASLWIFNADARAFADVRPTLGPPDPMAISRAMAEAGFYDWIILESIGSPSVLFVTTDLTLDPYFLFPSGIISIGGTGSVRLGDAGASLFAPRDTPLNVTLPFETSYSGMPLPFQLRAIASAQRTAPPIGGDQTTESTFGMTFHSMRISTSPGGPPVTGFTYRTASGLAYPLEGGIFAGQLEIPEPSPFAIVGAGGGFLLLAAIRRSRGSI